MNTMARNTPHSLKTYGMNNTPVPIPLFMMFAVAFFTDA